MGRKKKYKTEEERLEAKRIREAEYYQANKLKRSLYYKERYKKLKEDAKGWDDDHALDMVMNDMVSDWDVTINDGLTDLDTDDITFEAFDDDTSGDYEGIIT